MKIIFTILSVAIGLAFKIVKLIVLFTMAIIFSAE